MNKEISFSNFSSLLKPFFWFSIKNDKKKKKKKKKKKEIKMAASNDGSNIEINIEFQGLEENQEIKIFHGHATNERISINNYEKKIKVSYGGYVKDVESVNDKTILFGIYILEKTKNDKGLSCIRVKGNVNFKPSFLRKSLGKSEHFEKIVHNHCLDDEKKEVSSLRDKSKLNLRILNGTISVIKYPSFGRSFYLSNEIVKKDCIKPWYDIISETTKYFISPEMKTFHVPWMRFVTGPIIPFSCAFLWKNRDFDHFESDSSKCSSFVDIVSRLLSTSVKLHPEFLDLNDFFKKCNDFISRDEISSIGYSCMEVILDILVLKSVSEPYIVDKVRLKTSESIDVDQLSCLCHIYGSDCEDGDKYAFEMKRLITDSNWDMIKNTLNGNNVVMNIISTVVKIYRMLFNFSCTMYCKGDICHSINVLVDINTAKKWIKLNPSNQIKPNEEHPLKLIQNVKLFFNESTAYSSPFQKPFADDDHHISDFDTERHKKIELEKMLTNMIKSHHSELDVYDYFVPDKNHPSDNFYRYFTNFVTTDFQSIFPTVIDFIPIKNGNTFGFGLNDVYFNESEIQLIPRIDFGKSKLNYFEELVDGHHPNYDIIPNNFSLLKDYFNEKFIDEINNNMTQNIKKMNLTKKLQNEKGSTKYVKVNCFPIYGLSHSIKDMCKDIVETISYILSHDSQFSKFFYRIEKTYSKSQQTFMFLLYFYF